MLEISGISKSFGGLRALTDVSMTIEPSRITSVIGPNGAGKTTLMNIISGFTEPDAGAVGVNGTPAAGLRPHRLCSLGLARTFQNLQMFSDMSVHDVVVAGCYRHQKSSLLSDLLRLPGSIADEKSAHDRAARQLEFIGIPREFWNRRSGDLPYGIQRKTEIARALATEPKYMLLDEPAAGLNNQETADLGRTLGQIADLGIAVVLIEHDIELVMKVSSRIFVLDAGMVIASGNPQEIRDNPKVIEAYFGTGHDN